MMWAYITRLATVAISAITIQAVIAVGAQATPCAIGTEELRVELGETFLPDCRAYEMITPDYKEGYPLEPISYASNGEKLFLTSLADLANLEGEGESIEPAAYIGSRTPAAGWSLSPVNPSSGRYAKQVLVSAEANSDLSLWEMHTLEQSASTGELYVRSGKEQTAAEPFSRVGPLTETRSGEEPSNAGARLLVVPVASTSNFTHIVLRATNAEGRWAFDHTLGNGESLYEYSGTETPEPTLVAVIGEKGSTQLTGTINNQTVGFQCGASLGSLGRFSTYNAISSDGETVYFTPGLKGIDGCPGSAMAPEFGEVWARVHGSKDISTPAKTINVSERSPTECTGSCQTSTESGKNFEGASENGEKVFFTSTQQLLNSAHQDTVSADNATEGCTLTAGEGGCNLYEYDFAASSGHNLKLIAGGAEVLGVLRIAENGSRVYFAARAKLTSTPNVYNQVPQPGQPNVYIYNTETNSLSFIATLTSPADEEDWGLANEHPVEASASGRFLLFASFSPDVTPDDHTNGKRQLYLYDSQTGELVRISKAEGDDELLEENGNAGTSRLTTNNFDFLSSDFKSTAHKSNIAEYESTNGELTVTVSFESKGDLTTRAKAGVDGCFSVYEYRSQDTITTGDVHLISDGMDVEPFKGIRCGAELLAMDASGNNILFTTADSLLPSDTDGGQLDVYDARVNGGFPFNNELAGQCGNESCGVPEPLSPTFSAPSSLTQVPESVVINSGPPPKISSSKKRTSAATRCTSKRRRKHMSCKKGHPHRVVRGKRKK